MSSPSIKDKHPDRKNLGPTGPADAPLEGEQRYTRSIQTPVPLTNR